MKKAKTEEKKTDVEKNEEPSLKLENSHSIHFSESQSDNHEIIDVSL